MRGEKSIGLIRDPDRLLGFNFHFRKAKPAAARATTETATMIPISVVLPRPVVLDVVASAAVEADGFNVWRTVVTSAAEECVMVVIRDTLDAMMIVVGSSTMADVMGEVMAIMDVGEVESAAMSEYIEANTHSSLGQ